MGLLATIRSALARTIAPATAAPVRGSGGWWPVVHEPYAGAWQKNDETTTDTALSYWAVFACVTQIASNIAKLPLCLVAEDDEGIWSETSNPAYSPVLRKPNRYQTQGQFIEQWIVSKLLHGNTYVLKVRDQRGVVVSLHVLNPTQVTPLVAPDGAVYYQLGRDDLAGLTVEELALTPVVPASEIIHDVMVPLFHPLVGVTPIFACAMAVLQGSKILEGAANFFANGSRPGGILIAPGAITEEQAARLKETFTREYSGPNAGKLLVVSDGLKYEGLAMNAQDAQLIEQLGWTAVPICGCFRMPVFMIDSTKTPAYGNVEQLTLQFHSQCLQALMVSLETLLDEGLGLGPVFGNAYGTEFDIDDLFYMDTQTRTKAANDSIGSGALAPNEARKKYFGVGSVPGGDSPYLQQQYYSLEALAQRDAEQPFAKPVPAAVPTDFAAKAWAADLRQAVLEGPLLPDPAVVAEVVVEAVKATVAPLLARLAATETALVALQALERRVEALLADVGTVREKVAAVEVKTLQPGPPGAPGKDGTDGLGFDELECVDDGTGMVLRLTRGDQVKSVALAIPYDRGPFRLEEAYAKGNCVVHNGYWIAKAATKGIRPGEGPGPWRLIQKSVR